MSYLYHLAIAIDQLFNAFLGGYADETLSSRTYREATKYQAKKRWAFLHGFINGIFFWQKEHCKKAYESEKLKKHFPKDFQC